MFGSLVGQDSLCLLAIELEIYSYEPNTSLLQCLVPMQKHTYVEMNYFKRIFNNSFAKGILSDKYKISVIEL